MDEQITPPNTEPTPEMAPAQPPKKPRFKISDLTKKQKIIGISVITLFILAILSYAAFAYMKQTDQPVCTPPNCATEPSPTPITTPTPSPIPTPDLVPAALNGEMVPRGKENVHPLAVMIENHPQARPQSGLGEADLVYEALAEGGITRFMAVYKDPTIAVRVGPVRSARTYYVDFATELNAFYAHVGGSAPALAQISRTGVLDLNQFSVGSAAYARDFSRKVALEHTMYSSTEKLWNYATGTKGWSKTGDYAPWLFTDDAAVAKRPASQKISISVSSPQFDVVWDYNPADNTYARTMAGIPHIDADTNQQIKVKTIIIETATKNTVSEYAGANEKQILDYHLTGTGKASVVENGIVIPATWKKEGTGRTRYYDENGKEIAFVRGPIWVHIVDPDSRISF